MRGCGPSDRDLMALDEEVWRSNLGRGFEIGWPQAVRGAGSGVGSAGGEPSGGALPEFGQNVTWRPFRLGFGSGVMCATSRTNLRAWCGLTASRDSGPWQGGAATHRRAISRALGAESG